MSCWLPTCCRNSKEHLPWLTPATSLISVCAHHSQGWKSVKICTIFPKFRISLFFKDQWVLREEAPAETHRKLHGGGSPGALIPHGQALSGAKSDIWGPQTRLWGVVEPQRWQFLQSCPSLNILGWTQKFQEKIPFLSSQRGFGFLFHYF